MADLDPTFPVGEIEKKGNPDKKQLPVTILKENNNLLDLLSPSQVKFPDTTIEMFCKYGDTVNR